jgi:hypothetical protein
MVDIIESKRKKHSWLSPIGSLLRPNGKIVCQGVVSSQIWHSNASIFNKLGLLANESIDSFKRIIDLIARLAAQLP